MKTDCGVPVNPSSNAGDVGSIPGSGTKTQHAAGQPSPGTGTREAFMLQQRPHHPQKLTVVMGAQPSENSL